MLAVESLETRYKNVVALRDVTLHVGEGEFVAIIGANGAGKSTLLNTVAGLLKPRSGHVAFEGADVTGHTSDSMVERGVVLVPEGRQVFPRMSVDDNLRLGAYTPRARADAAATMSWVYELFPRLAERRDQMAATMSGGEQQMLALGRALMASPKLLLLDEPSLGLAPVAIDAIFESLAALRGTLTAVVVEQDAQRALELCERGYVMAEGEVGMAGSASTLLDDPRLVAAYLGLEFSND